MVIRKPKNPELAAAANHLAEAAHHVRQAVSQKIDHFGAAAALELDKARQVALAQGGQASRKFESLMKRARQQLTRATNAAKKSLDKAVRESEKKLQAMDKAVQVNLVDLQRAGQAKGPAGTAVARKGAPRKAPAKKAAARKPAARKSAA